ncbi:MAG: M48 family metallopeptidase [Kiritimatiellales bacterium]|nr:M48 family metallopeptidase [Kiritimatiellales bacterium]
MTENTTPTREDLAREYDAVHNRLFLVQILMVAVLLAAYQLSGASAALADGLVKRFGESLWYLTNGVYVLVTVFGFAAFMFPLSYYTDYVLEHHYELSHEDFGMWLLDFTKSLLIDLVLAVILFEVVYALLRWQPVWWWVFATAFYILFAIIISTIAPVVIMPLFHKFEPLAEGDLTDAVKAMMEEAGIAVAGVFKSGLEENPGTANAAFTGFGKTRRIVLGDTLLAGYSQDEILAIIAHEVGHYKNRDMFRLMLTGSAMALVGFYVSHLCLTGLSGGLGRNIADIATAPVFIFSLFVFSLISMPFANMHSRRREYAADAYAVEKMGEPDSLVSAFVKLADQNLSNQEPAAWIEFLLHSQPSIARRIVRARENMSAIGSES